MQWKHSIAAAAAAAATTTTTTTTTTTSTAMTTKQLLQVLVLLQQLCVGHGLITGSSSWRPCLYMNSRSHLNDLSKVDEGRHVEPSLNSSALASLFRYDYKYNYNYNKGI